MLQEDTLCCAAPSALESLRAQVRQIEGRHQRAGTAHVYGLVDLLANRIGEMQVPSQSSPAYDAIAPGSHRSKIWSLKDCCKILILLVGDHGLEPWTR